MKEVGRIIFGCKVHPNHSGLEFTLNSIFFFSTSNSNLHSFSSVGVKVISVELSLYSVLTLAYLTLCAMLPQFSNFPHPAIEMDIFYIQCLFLRKYEESWSVTFAI